MRHGYKLNLPSNPLNAEYKDSVLTIEQSDVIWKTAPPWKLYRGQSVEKIIKIDILEKLRSLNLEPNLIVLFFMNRPVSYDRSYIHRDIALLDNQWVDVPFGINFEINPNTETTISWWDTSGLKEFQDDTDEVRENFGDFSAIRYNENRLRSTPKHVNATVKETLQVQGDSNPILFRTNVAHSITTYTSSGDRFNLSLRFDLSKNISFEEAVFKLQPLIIGSHGQF